MTSQEDQSTAPRREGEQPDVHGQEGRPVGVGSDLDQAIQQQIAQAVQPVLAQMQQQIAQELRQQLEQARHPQTEPPQAGAQPRIQESEKAGQVPAAGVDLGQVLQEQIALAFQPVLAEFRQGVEQSMQQLEQESQPVAQKAPEPSREEGRQRQAQQPVSQVQEEFTQPAHEELEPRVDRGAQRGGQGLLPTLVDPLRNALAAALQEQAERMSDLGERCEEPDLRPALAQPLRDALAEAFQGQAEQTLRAALDVGLDALFSKSVRVTVEQLAGQALQLLLLAALNSLPPDLDRRKLQRQAEQMIQEVLRESVDTIFSGALRAEFQLHGELAIHALVQMNFGAALQQGEQGLQLVLQRILLVLKQYWEQILRLLLSVIVRELQVAIASRAKETAEHILAAPGKAVNENVGSVQEELQEKGEDLREHLAEAVETLRQRLEESRKHLQQNLEEGVRSAGRGGAHREQRLGVPPSVQRPMSGRPPSAQRPPSGVPPSVRRPPSGRPPSATSR